MNIIQKAKGFLFDLDGVFYLSGQPLEGAVETLSYLRENEIPFRFLTNTTTINRKTLKEKLDAIKLYCSEDEIISAGFAGINYLREMGSPTCRFFISDNLKLDYVEFVEDLHLPEVVVIGDYDGWTFELLNQAFRYLMDGAEIIALQKGRYYKVDDGLQLDAGGFVKALEYTTGKQAHVVGKPNKAFFQYALDDLNLGPGEVVMLGDDLVNDVKGAQEIGVPGVLVKTGKYHEGMVESSSVNPDGFINSISDLPKLLNKKESL